MTALTAALTRCTSRLLARLEDLEHRLDTGDATAWAEYVATASALAAVAAEARPERRGELLTTAEMAGRVGIAPETLLRRARRGRTEAPIRLAKRGAGAIRWRGSEVAR